MEHEQYISLLHYGYKHNLLMKAARLFTFGENFCLMPFCCHYKVQPCKCQQISLILLTFQINFIFSCFNVLISSEEKCCRWVSSQAGI